MREPRQETNIHVSGSLSCITTTTYTDAACLVQCATIWVGSCCAFQPSILTLTIVLCFDQVQQQYVVAIIDRISAGVKGHEK